jgi:hypothetical protein
MCMHSEQGHRPEVPLGDTAYLPEAALSLSGH